jgi:ArsR family transcriptional regulator, lead/cadmium/zinc/bismuth-responsive transcriptional repressor
MMEFVAASTTGPGQRGSTLDNTSPLSADRAAELAALFKILASDTRLRLLHALDRGGEVRVSDLAAEVGASPQLISNQLQRLLDRGILGARKSGTSVYYHIADPCVPTLLQAGLCLIETQNVEFRQRIDPAQRNCR